MWPKFLCWVNSVMDFRVLVCVICTAWFCCVCNCNWVLAACWALNNCMTYLFISTMLWSKAVSPGCIKEKLGRPWGPGGMGGSEGIWGLHQVNLGELHQEIQGTTIQKTRRASTGKSRGTPTRETWAPPLGNSWGLLPGKPRGHHRGNLGGCHEVPMGLSSEGHIQIVLCSPTLQNHCTGRPFNLA